MKRRLRDLDDRTKDAILDGIEVDSGYPLPAEWREQLKRVRIIEEQESKPSPATKPKKKPSSKVLEELGQELLQALENLEYRRREDGAIEYLLPFDDHAALLFYLGGMVRIIPDGKRGHPPLLTEFRARRYEAMSEEIAGVQKELKADGSSGSLEAARAIVAKNHNLQSGEALRTQLREDKKVYYEYKKKMLSEMYRKQDDAGRELLMRWLKTGCDDDAAAFARKLGASDDEINQLIKRRRDRSTDQG
jgi:hypothetical protein